ncbi:uncharacterized protein LOC143071516 [Mytilus galloprovincialis]|uniref:uncharacterized protein LOC143071516 n=1 Tax=Mytilus galloprovincialis TaxID=29158 RepID=UPI003F7CC042
MDISCEMELPFTESSSLTGTSFEHSAADLPVKLLGSSEDVDHLLHGNPDKHLSAADFKLDLGVANDLVSEFGMPNESLMMPEEQAEEYSISDAALEGGVRPAVTSSNIVAMDNINYVHSIPLISTLSGIQTVQVIPFGYLISGAKPNTNQQAETTQVNINSFNQSTPTHIQTVHNAVVIGNLMMLKDVNQSQNSNQTKQIDTDVRATSEKCVSKVKLSNNKTTNVEMSRRVANKKNMVNNRLHKNQSTSLQNKVQSSQKNTKIKIDGKTISLTFEVKDVRQCDLTEWQTISQETSTSKEANSVTTSTVDKEEKLVPMVTKSSPQLQIFTNVKDASDNTKYVSLLKGQNNCLTLRKNDNTIENKTGNTKMDIDKDFVEELETRKFTVTAANSESVANESKDSVETTKDKTEELENEVLTLLANASKERTRVEQEQSKGIPGRKKCGKPCGNLPTNEELFKCDICGLEFNRHGNFTRHKLIHDVRFKDRYKCSVCERKFLQRCDLKRHLLIHSNQEPYRCQECGKGYIRRSDLVVHMRFHKKERVFACPYCSDKKFCQSGDLNRHVRNVHLHSSTHKCGHCDRQFSKEPALIQHQYTFHENVLSQNSKKRSKGGLSNSAGNKGKSANKKKTDVA